MAFLFIGTAVYLLLGGVSPIILPNKNGTAATLQAGDAVPGEPLPDGLFFDRLQVEKRQHRLTAFFKGKPMRVYLVALGLKPEGHKEYEGDRRTPEGRYFIDSKEPDSFYYKTLGISYPNKADRTHAAAIGKAPGGNIKIHGLAGHYADLGQAHRITDWTLGSIALTNPEMEELFTRTPVGTPIDILP